MGDDAISPASARWGGYGDMGHGFGCSGYGQGNCGFGDYGGGDAGVLAGAVAGMAEGVMGAGVASQNQNSGEITECDALSQGRRLLSSGVGRFRELGGQSLAGAIEILASNIVIY